MFIGPAALTYDTSKVIGFGKADGLPRMEIDDTAMRLRVPIDELQALGTRKFRLGDLVDHPRLFAAYPELGTTKVTLVCNKDGNYSSTFLSHGGNIKCEYPHDFCERQFLGALSHEVQHGIQLIEGFYGGVSQNENVLTAYNAVADRLGKRHNREQNPRLEQKYFELRAAATLFIDGDPSEAEGRVDLAVTQLRTRSKRIYMQAPGEIEARATDARLTLSDFERQLQLPEHLQREPVNHAVVARVYDGSMQRVRDMFNRERKKALGDGPVRHFFARIFHTALS